LALTGSHSNSSAIRGLYITRNVWSIGITIQGFSRREREIPFEPADLFAREADGCKPVLGRLRSANVSSRVMSFVIAGTKRCGTTITV